MQDELLRSERSCVIHGDWKPDNLILSMERPPRVLAVVDWELSTIGHPMSDLANLCLPYHLGEFGKVVNYPPLGGESGISEEEVLQSYCRAAKANEKDAKYIKMKDIS